MTSMPTPTGDNSFKANCMWIPQLYIRGIVPPKNIITGGTNQNYTIYQTMDAKKEMKKG